MKNITRCLWIGTLCLGMGALAGCSQPNMGNALSGTMQSMSATTSSNLLTQGIASANKGDTTTAVSYLSSWYAIQPDKAVARQQLQNLAKLKANAAASKTINDTLNKLAN